ncbi:MAG: KTSC domain-containing protein [Fibrobacterales bacterium]
MSKWISTPQSSNVAGFGYEATKLTLTVVFNNGSKYEYYNVPDNIYRGIVAADSKGTYLNRCIKGVFTYKHIG